MPRWEKAPVNPHEKPETIYSKFRGSGPGLSNSQMLDSLAAAVDMSPSTAKCISGQITWWDAMGDPERPPFLTGGSWTVTGGRLGRDHTFEDVPSHYVRDRLMDYAMTMIDEDRQDAAYAALCPDLNQTEIADYVSLIAKLREDLENHVARSLDSESRHKFHPEKATQKVKKKSAREELEQLKHILENKHVNSIGEAKNIIRQEELLDAIDDSIDLTPIPHFKVLDRDTLDGVVCSVIRPGKAHDQNMLPSEQNIAINEDIDQNCDQVRAMIKIFVRENEWTLDQFRNALGISGRQPLLDFLEKKGPTYGIDSQCFQLSWEFFKRRQKLNLPLKGAPSESILRERSANRGCKRRSVGAEDEKDNGMKNVAKVPKLEAS
ncbi:hypothetical protein F5Y19DRAFT_473548 [Xylariaceae sp. FL1651]|nr:hypothetical protein F5Y19DRAFT_473548 [Xylariaceae sp. FL1651]